MFIKKTVSIVLSFMLCVLVAFSASHQVAEASKDIPRIEIKPRYDAGAIAPGEEVVLSIHILFQAPVLPKVKNRPPVSVALVLDRSGSMDEAKKLDYAIAAGKVLVNSLEADDQFALVIYDSDVEVLYPLGKVKDKKKLIRMIESITPGGMTNLSGGLEEGISQLANIKKEGACRVVLLSDGLANVGMTNAEAVAAISAKAKKSGIGVTTIGLGLDFDEALMQHTAQRGGGQYYYIKDSELLPSVFKEELALAVDAFTKDLQVVFTPRKQVEDVKIYGTKDASSDKPTVIEMSDLSSGESSQIVMSLKIKPETATGVQNFGNLKVRYTEQKSGKTIDMEVPLEIEVTADVKAREAANAKKTSEIKTVREEIVLLKAEEAHVLAMESLAQGKHEQAKKILADQQVVLQGYAKDNALIANKMVQIDMHSKQIDRAKHDIALQKQMDKSSKAYFYHSMKGNKKDIMLQHGDKGYQIENLQLALKKLNFYKGKIDGVYSDELKEAVKAYQESKNLTADGIAGPATMHSLGF